ncbi:MAG TPA: hypothetical protein VKA46_33865 [Gemmataceae bacterium]|nr:hypothetical protein [Gemmataceae bacterium]
MSKSTTRRGFLAAGLAGLAAGPAVAAGVSTPAAVAIPSQDGIHHNLEFAEYDCCACPDCRHERAVWGSHPLVIDVLVALQAARVALERLKATRATTDLRLANDDDLFLDADAAAQVIGRFYGWLEGEVCHTDEINARLALAGVHDTALPAYSGAQVSLYGCLDALLDLTTGHGDSADECYICNDADVLVYFVRNALSMIGCSNQGDADDSAKLAVEERALLTAQRKMARLQRCVAEGGSMLPHTAHEHVGAEDGLLWAEQDVAVMRGVIQKKQRGSAVGRGRRRRGKTA